ncbi:MAG: asparagine synthetase B, partial [Rhizobiales bacterium]|nr:asparagine synthetase B [Hyphomicrobiales bacterium]
MCGIVGVFALGSSNVDPSVVERMRDAMQSRGPDGAGLWMSERCDVGLGHRRLSIIDLSTLANQPMPNEDRSVWLTFNGEIYNHHGLRRELLDKRHRFTTDHSDTEVLVHGFEEWGIDGLLERLSGDFAFGIYDAKEDALYLARDQIGVKPIYFGIFGDEFVFGSEIKALMEHPRAERDIDPYAMIHYLSFLTTPAPMTMFKGVYKLPAGCRLRVGRDGSCRLHRYYDAAPGKGIRPEEVAGLSDRARESFYVDGIRTRLRGAVQRRMMSDVPF